jgi:hypothetical protein
MTGFLVMPEDDAEVAGDSYVWDAAVEGLSYMLGIEGAVTTMQLMDAIPQCTPYLYKWFPWLESLNTHCRAISDARKAGTLLNKVRQGYFRIDGYDLIDENDLPHELMKKAVRECTNMLGSNHVLQVLPLDDQGLADDETIFLRIRPDGANAIIHIETNEDEPPSEIGNINWKVDKS